MHSSGKGALGATFTAARAMQAISLIAIIGMTANFVGMMVVGNAVPPDVLIGTLSVTCIAVLYCTITYLLYHDGILPLLIASGLDAALLIACVVIAVTTGKRLSYLNCAAISASGGNANAFVDSEGQNLNKVDYIVWASADSTTCFEMKSIWGLSIALCVLFALSSTVTVCIWKRQKMVAAPKDVEH